MTATTLARSNSPPYGATNEKRASSSFGCSTTASKKGFAAGVFAGARSHGTTTSRRRPATFLRASLSNDDFESEDQMRRDDEEYAEDEDTGSRVHRSLERREKFAREHAHK